MTLERPSSFLLTTPVTVMRKMIWASFMMMPMMMTMMMMMMMIGMIMVMMAMFKVLVYNI